MGSPQQGFKLNKQPGPEHEVSELEEKHAHVTHVAVPSCVFFDGCQCSCQKGGHGGCRERTKRSTLDRTHVYSIIEGNMILV